MINQHLSSYLFLQNIMDWKLSFHRSIISLCSLTTFIMIQLTESCRKIQFYLERSLCLKNQSNRFKENKCLPGKKLSLLLIKILSQSRKYSSKKHKRFIIMNRSNLINRTMIKIKWSIKMSTKTFQNTCLLFEKDSLMEQPESILIKLIWWKWKWLSENSTENTFEDFLKTQVWRIYSLKLKQK